MPKDCAEFDRRASLVGFRRATHTLTAAAALLQETLTNRALELLALPEDDTPRLLLDLGCGSGLSGEALSEAGHTWLVSNNFKIGLTT